MRLALLIAAAGWFVAFGRAEQARPLREASAAATALSGVAPLPVAVTSSVVAVELAPPEPARTQTPDRNPVPYAPASVARGKSLYLQNCQSCHDEDGRARSAAVAIAADLTDPSRWKFGTNDVQLFKTIKNGAAEAMPPFGVDLKDEQIWDVVNFIRSIGPAANRPPLR